MAATNQRVSIITNEHSSNIKQGLLSVFCSERQYLHQRPLDLPVRRRPLREATTTLLKNRRHTLGLFKQNSGQIFFLGPKGIKSITTLTDGINLVHEDDARLMVPGIVEHLSDQPGTLTNVLINYRAGHHLERGEVEGMSSLICNNNWYTQEVFKSIKSHLQKVTVKLAGYCSGQEGLSGSWWPWTFHKLQNDTTLN